MKRGEGFKRPQIERKPRAPLVPLDEPVRATMQVSALFLPQPKRTYIRSKSLMKAYRMIPCQNCGTADGTVCGAHSNWAAHGKGKSVKGDDNRAASLCFTCHSQLDQGNGMAEPVKQRMWWRAHVLTVRLLVMECMWPAGVPVPPVLEYPKEWILEGVK